jgi:hypothetical protein
MTARTVDLSFSQLQTFQNFAGANNCASADESGKVRNLQPEKEINTNPFYNEYLQKRSPVRPLDLVLTETGEGGVANNQCQAIYFLASSVT